MLIWRDGIGQPHVETHAKRVRDSVEVVSEVSEHVLDKLSGAELTCHSCFVPTAQGGCDGEQDWLAARLGEEDGLHTHGERLAPDWSVS